MGKTKKQSFQPNPEQLALRPDIPGSQINGVGEVEIRRPTPIYWRPAERIIWGAMQQYYYSQNTSAPAMAARDKCMEIAARPLGPMAGTRQEASPGDWTKALKAEALSGHSDQVAVTNFRSEWVYDDSEADYPWMVIIAVAMDYEPVAQAPSIRAFFAGAGGYRKRYGGVGQARLGDQFHLWGLVSFGRRCH